MTFSTNEPTIIGILIVILIGFCLGAGFFIAQRLFSK